MCANKRFYASMITTIREMTTDFTVVATVSVCDFHYDCSFIIIHSFTPPFSKAIIMLGGWMADVLYMHRQRRCDAAYTKYTESLCIVIQKVFMRLSDGTVTIAAYIQMLICAMV